LERVDPADLARELVDAVLQVVERTERAGAARQVRQALHRLLALAREAADDVVIGGLARRHVIGGLAGRHARSHSTTGDGEPDSRARIRATSARTAAVRPLTTSSASPSYGVSSRLTMASMPPARTVSPGSPATGQTSSEDPSTSRRPVSRQRLSARAIARSGSSSPNITTPGLRIAPHS